MESRPKRGFFVCEIEPLLPAAAEPARPAAKADGTAAPLVDFSPGGIDTRHFPYTTWRRLLRACFDEADATLLQNAPAQGLFSLRASIAQYLAQARGVRCQARQIVIGAGTEHLLQILSYMLDSSWTIALEMQFYLIFPWSARAANKRPALTIGAMMLAGLGYRAFQLNALTDYNLVVNQLPAFLDVYAVGIKRLIAATTD